MAFERAVAPVYRHSSLPSCLGSVREGGQRQKDTLPANQAGRAADKTPSLVANFLGRLCIIASNLYFLYLSCFGLNVEYCIFLSKNVNIRIHAAFRNGKIPSPLTPGALKSNELPILFLSLPFHHTNARKLKLLK